VVESDVANPHPVGRGHAATSLAGVH